MDTLDRLRRFEVLSHLNEGQLRTLADCTARVRMEAGATVFGEGDESTDAYLVDRGRVRIQRRTPYGAFTLAELGMGELFGENTFIDGNPRSGEALVVEDVTLFPISPVALRTVVGDDQRFTVAMYWAFWKSLSRKLRATNETLASFFSKSGVHARPPAETTADPAEVRVGIDAKRDLFREQRLSRMEINFLSALSRERRLEAGETLFREGEPGEEMYVVLEGRVMISKEIVGAGEEALAILERGDYFGEMGLIDQKPRSADAKAHEGGALVLAITREVLEGILDIQKVSSLRLLKLLCGLVAKRLREVDDKLIGWYIFDAGSGESLDLPQ